LRLCPKAGNITSDIENIQRMGFPPWGKVLSTAIRTGGDAALKAPYSLIKSAVNADNF
jgi:hypothetical protein